MSDFRTRLEGLSPAKRRLLESELRRKGLSLPHQLIVRRNGAEPCPASFAQQRLWFLAQLDPKSSVYNVPKALRIHGTLNIEALRHALNAVVARHEALRSTFHFVDGNLVQVIGDSRPLDFPIIDLRSTSTVERQAAIQRAVQEEAQRPFDLSRDLMIRTPLFCVGEEEHVLMLTLHHIVSDAWSTGILFREMASLYEDFCESRPLRLPELPIQYGDYAIWQREQLEGGALASHLAYWSKQLEHLAPILELPTDRPRPITQSGRGAKHSFRLPSHVGEGIEALSLREGVTLFTTLLAAFQTLLHRYTGKDDIVVGSPFSCRDRVETESLIGFFVNTLPLRTDLAGDPSFRELLGRVRDVTLGAYAHQELPFEKLVEELRPDRNLTHTPIFQSVFVMAPDRQEPKIADLNITSMEVDSGTAKFDLTLAMRIAANKELLGSFEYNSDLLDGSTVQRMSGHFETLLEGILSNPELPLSHLPLKTEAERLQVMNEDSDIETDDIDGICIHQWFEYQVQSTPESVALVFNDRELTYGELNRTANQLAHLLQKMGVGPEVLVGLLLERSLEMVVAVLAVLKAGGAYVPMDTAHPADRLAFMLSDANPRVLITEKALQSRIPEPRPAMIVLDSDFQSLSAESSENLSVEISASNLAYVIYTSGSTGNPKGTLITHQNVIRLFKTTEHWFGFGSSDVWTLFHSVAFDFSVWEICGALLYGGKLVIVPFMVSRSPDVFYELLVQQRVTVLNQTPSAFQQLMDSEPAPAPNVNRNLSLRLVVLGGEALQPRMLRPWFEKHGDEKPQIINMYGITETTVHVTYQPITSAMCEAGSLIGRPLPDLRVYVLDQKLRRVPQGVAGEIHVGGPGLARGYLNRQDLTAARFIANPFDGNSKSLLYKSGDLARVLPDGDLQYLGRLDDQVKIRGFRVELREIETVLLQHPAVREGAVLFREVATGGKGLVAYLTCDANSSPSANEMRTFMRQKLPDYMVPAAFVVLDRFPLTSNGKLDRKSLPAPETTSLMHTAEYVAPRNHVEEVLAGIWGEVLHRQRVSIVSNFFELGGHSLLVTQVASRIRRVFHVDLPVRKLFEAPTVEALSQFILTRDDTAGQVEGEFKGLIDETAGIDEPFDPAGAASGRYPLSFAQQRLWFLSQLEPENPAYNVPTAIRIRGPLDTPALERALTRVVARHQTLRSTFDVVSGTPVQIVRAAAKVEMPVTDLRPVGATEREGEIQRLSEEEASRSFNLSTDLMIRTLLLKVSDQEHVLLLTMHHIASDGWSMWVLFREIASFYEEFRGGAASGIPELPIQYADYAIWQRQRFESAILASDLAYWRKQLAHLPPLLQVPTDRPRPAIQSHRGDKHSFRLSRDLCERLKALSLREGVTLYMTLLAAFQTLLHRYTGKDDIAIGSPIAGRLRMETEGLIGFFVNTLVLRTDLSGDPSFRRLLVRVKDVALEAFAHQELPFEKLVEELQPDRNLGHNPLFQVLFVMQNVPGQELALPGLRLTRQQIHNKTSKFDLTFSMSDRLNTDQVISGSLEYNTDLFDVTTIRRMCGHFETLLESILADPEQPLSSYALMTNSERRQVLQEWNHTGSVTSKLCIHQSFESQVKQTPEGVALMFDGQKLSYGELNRRANQLALSLKRMGVGPEILVGLFLERSLNMVVALLGVLKAGGAYVPLDTSYPVDRLAYMLADAGPKVLITEKALKSRIPESELSTIFLDSDWHSFAANSSDDLKNDAALDNLVYVLYTSGSTGTPKGVAMTHRALANLINWQCRQSNQKESQRTLQFASLSFDVSFQEIFSTLCSGGSLVLIQDEVRRDPVSLLRLIREERINRLFVPFVALQMLADAAENANTPPSTLSEVYTAGEQLFITPAIRTLFDKLPECSFHNQYGPTETHVVTAYTLPVQRSQWESRTPIGCPIANTETYILDQHQQPVPIGLTGELYIAGAGLARGYLKRPDLTAEKFVQNPFIVDPGSRVYKSGDLARYRADGNIEFLGRMDNQVKLRGFRIELGEIESVLGQHPAVRQAIAALREDNSGDQRIVAYVVRQEGRTCAIQDLRIYLGKQLPEYMIPSGFVFLEALPLTPSGKVARNLLPPPLQDAASTKAVFVAPRTPTEHVTAKIWCEILKLERISIADNFFDLGGHSLLATQVASRIRSLLRVELPLHRLFEAPTVERLSQVMIAEQKTPGQVERISRIVMDIAAMSSGEVKRNLEKMKKQEQT